jgi:hypothetical protein
MGRRERELAKPREETITLEAWEWWWESPTRSGEDRDKARAS